MVWAVQKPPDAMQPPINPLSRRIALPDLATIRHPAELLIPAWASIDGISSELDFLLHTLCLTTSGKRNGAIRYLATALDTIADCGEPLARWRLAGEQTYGLHDIACAWSARRQVDGKIVARRPSLNVAPTEDSLISGNLKVEDHYLYYLLQSKLPESEGREAHINLVAWTLVTGLRMASARFRNSRYLREVCKTLRLAAYEGKQNTDRNTLIRELAGRPASYLAMQERLGGEIPPSLRRVSLLTDVIRSLEALSKGETGGIQETSEGHSAGPGPAAVHDKIASINSAESSGGFWESAEDQPEPLLTDTDDDQADDLDDQEAAALVTS